ncbi:hypothetical protein VC83_05126 [Pseudogymnoascus destructans]|uniref:HPP transmembrane region domain-containing protein n=1 Tax=Pseudogymnoascus destructans TaxID=655981 RepID=A0A177AC24_9PEZI|nr:uncharacterized protein VC83_05126 [Pseudogymnoascus destructans]OAF58734.1 hypothetical protein VC83_05126 [Pseudogymnoascus destructans]
MLPSSMSPPPSTASAASPTASKTTLQPPPPTPSLSPSPSPAPTPAPLPRRPFDIDHHLNPFIPPPRLHLLPGPLAHLLGHRPHPHPLPPTLLTTLLALLGTFTGLALATLLFHHLPSLSPATDTNPLIIASLGATAILLYSTPASPLAQPRPLLLGQTISATVGILIALAFRSLGPEEFERLRWLAGALAVAVAAAVMAITKTVHPPAGATALLAVTSDEIVELGWGLLALIEVGCAAMLVVALVWGNVHGGRRYPVFWWTEMELGKGGVEEAGLEVEKEMEEGRGERVVVLPQGFVLSEGEREVLERIAERVAAAAAAKGGAPEVKVVS